MAKNILKSRLGICDICETVDAKYTCPACEINTCSLSCCKKHKKDNDCDGIRVRTSFVKIEDYGNVNFLNDSSLLEDISCKVATCRRDKLTKGANVPQHRVHNKSTKLKQAVMGRGADLLILPNQFHRHKNNTSIFDFRRKLIKWKVQLIFLNASRFTVYDEKCSEETTISSLIEKHLNNSNVSPEIAFKKLKTYRKVGLRNLSVLMKAERVPVSDKKFYKLDLEKSLRENFIGKTIVEFPQLFVVINGCFTTRKPRKNNSAKTNETNFLISSDDKPPNLQGSTTKKMTPSTSEESDGEDIDLELETDVRLPSYRDLIQQQ